MTVCIVSVNYFILIYVLGGFNQTSLVPGDKLACYSGPWEIEAALKYTIVVVDLKPPNIYC